MYESQRMNVLQSGQNLPRLPSSFLFSEKTHIASQHNPKRQIEPQEGIQLSRHVVYSDRTVHCAACLPLAEEKHSRTCSSRLKEKAQRSRKLAACENVTKSSLGIPNARSNDQNVHVSMTRGTVSWTWMPRRDHTRPFLKCIEICGIRLNNLQ